MSLVERGQRLIAESQEQLALHEARATAAELARVATELHAIAAV